MMPLGGAGLPPPSRFVPASRRFDLPSGCFGLPCLSPCLVFVLCVSFVEAQLHRACSPGVRILFQSMRFGFRGLRWCFRHRDTTCDPFRPHFRLIFCLCWANAVASFRLCCPCLYYMDDLCFGSCHGLQQPQFMGSSDQSWATSSFQFWRDENVSCCASASFHSVRL